MLLLLFSATLSDNFLTTAGFLTPLLPGDCVVFFLVGDGEFLPMDPVLDTFLEVIGVLDVDFSLAELLVEAFDGVLDKLLLPPLLFNGELFVFNILVGSLALNCDLLAGEAAAEFGVGLKAGLGMETGSGFMGVREAGGGTIFLPPSPPPNNLIRSLMGVRLLLDNRGADILM